MGSLASTIATGAAGVILIVLFVILVTGVPAAAIAADKSNRTMGRKSFLFWLLATSLVSILAEMLFTASEGSSPTGFVLVLLGAVLVALGMILVLWVLPRRVLWRVRDAGWNPASSYIYAIYAIPFGNIIFPFVLLFVPSATASREAPLADRQQTATSAVDEPFLPAAPS